MTGELVIDEELDELLDSLTELQRRFVSAMLKTPNAGKAYRMAGGSSTDEVSVRAGAYQLLTNTRVARTLKLLRLQRQLRTQVEADWVIEQLVETYERCMQKMPVLDEDGNETGVWKFDSAGAAKCLDMLMKHMGCYDKDNRQKTGAADLDAIRARLQQRGIDARKTKALPGET